MVFYFVVLHQQVFIETMAGAPKGNNNAGKGTDWRDAIRFELARIGREIEGDDPAYKKGLRKCAQEFIAAAQQGEGWALRELGDRMDGKPAQAIEASGELTLRRLLINE